MRTWLLVGTFTMCVGIFVACGDSAPCGALCNEAEISEDAATRADTYSRTDSAFEEDTSIGTEDVTVEPMEDGGADVPNVMMDASVDAGPTMGFFVTSMGSGAAGGNLGGLTGADAICQAAAAAVGAGGKTWHAYLSTNTNSAGALVHAKDRIGSGPWYNQKLQLVADTLTTLHAADIPAALVLDEKGATVPVVANTNRHDILTGSTAAGEATMENCQNWTSNGTNRNATVGHSDSTISASLTDRWNSAHVSVGCSEAGLLTAGLTGGTGRIYCFAL